MGKTLGCRSPLCRCHPRMGEGPSPTPQSPLGQSLQPLKEGYQAYMLGRIDMGMGMGAGLDVRVQEVGAGLDGTCRAW